MPAPYAQFVLFGDSITQDSFDQGRGFGFSAALQHDYSRKLDVVNRGLSGYNTRQALQVLPTIVPSPDEVEIRFLTIWFGANDASLPEAPNKQHIPLDEYRDNLEKIITHPLIKAHNARIILITPPPVNEHLWWPRDELNGYTSISRIAGVTKTYADAASDVGTKLGIPVVHLWNAFMEKAKFKAREWRVGDELPGAMKEPVNEALVDLMYDGLHFHPAGYRVLYDEVTKLIAEKWPDQVPQKLAYIYPSWNDVDAWKRWTDAQKRSAT